MSLMRCRPAYAPLAPFWLLFWLPGWFGPFNARAEDDRFREPLAPPIVAVPRPVNDVPAADAERRSPLRVNVTQPGSSTKEELARAIQRLPLRELSAADRQRINAIITAPSLFRRLPTVTCHTDPRVYSFFVAHPDVAVSIWRVMGISDMQMRQVAENEYETDLKDGTFGTVEVLYRSENCTLVLCSGDFKSPLLARSIRSTGLMCLHTQFSHDAEGNPYVTHTGDVFVVFHSDAIEAIAKLISPMSFRMADKNFEEVTLFVRLMDEAMSRQPGWVERTASRMDGVIPGRDTELLEVAARVYVDAQRRSLQQTGASVTLEAILPPVQTAEHE